MSVLILGAVFLGFAKTYFLAGVVPRCDAASGAADRENRCLAEFCYLGVRASEINTWKLRDRDRAA
jgi:hypothetical protein